MINALYSLFWDIRIDWSLGHLRTNGPRRLRYPFLRPTLHFPSPYLYYLAILLDGAIRFAWFFRVYPLAIAMRAELRDPKHVHDTGGLAGVDLALKVLEVLRRWMWTFFRIEREVGKP